MAPPNHRRPGFSRRAQYALFSGYVVAVVGVIAALLLIIAAHFDPRGFRAVQGVASDAGSPFMSVGRSIARLFGATDDVIAYYLTAVSTNDELKAELARARTRLVQARVIEAQNRELRSLLKLQDQRTDVVANSRLIGSTLADARRIAVIAAGTNAGVRSGFPVRAANGLIGRVLNTGAFSARVLLLTDASSVVPIRILRDGSPGFVTGNGDGTLEVRGLSAGARTFRRGDILVTSGAGGLYPPHIPVALVISSRGDEGTAVPIADPAAVDYVTVLGLYRPEKPADEVPTAPAQKVAAQKATTTP
ncbi:rod shape-determining protein MreC [Aquisediminimonas sediminicola]|uniref:rod shape-determining protein MreC n=1 Tax=Alteraquisediminimonas sediminicola TaxID=2676787 RepID=UPI001C8DB460|nr:rod shape-determining protein MreC [Aquisediminimonas sediminicola]